MGSTTTRFWLITVALAVALAMSGCGGGGGNGDVPMPGGLPDVDYIPMGNWEVFSGPSEIGIEHEGYGLRVRYDSNLRPDIVSSRSYQPTIAGRWTGEWLGFEEDDDELLRNDAWVDVTLDSGVTNAELTYEGTPVGDISSGMMSVTDGAFSGSRTIPDTGTFQIRGQFGGSDQASGVAGYVHGPGFRSVFYGDEDR